MYDNLILGIHVCMPRIKLSYIRAECEYKNQSLYNINFITRDIDFTRKLGWLSHRAAAEHTNSTGNRPGATHASRRSLHHRSPYHLQLLSSVTARVSRLMVATKHVKGKTIMIYAGSNKLRLIVESTLHVRFINFSNLVTMSVDPKNPTQKIVQ
jgi:hypothetical protein